ncbi:MAG: phosphodiester glycosidase family protein [Lachnospiraceae bacterium]|nr:phosphodiester glycosidase family protein [Lachnospiraceae bacterium]
MNKRLRRTLIWGYIAALLLFTLYAALDTFVIPHRMTAVSAAEQAQAALTGEAQSAAAQVTSAQHLDTGGEVVGTYEDDDTSIVITKVREYNTDIYIADILVSDVSALRSAFAEGTYGRNVKEDTSDIAASNDAVLAINGDFYGSRTQGYVIRNGVLYRDSADSDAEGLALFADGGFAMYRESEIPAADLLAQGAVQAWSFGPALLADGEIAVTENEEVGRAMASNPRTAIGFVSDLHYVFVVSDGRTSESTGLSLSELAKVMRSVGVTDAYNLDGGGSSTLVFQGEVLNHPTTNGRRVDERAVSDIIYIGRKTT